MRAAAMWLRDELPYYLAMALMTAAMILACIAFLAWALLCRLAKPVAAVACVAIVCWAALKAMGVLP